MTILEESVTFYILHTIIIYIYIYIYIYIFWGEGKWTSLLEKTN